MKRYDITGIGNAIVDVLAHVPDEFIARQRMEKGAMVLIDEVRAESLYMDFPPATECSGGAVANTLAGMAQLGAKCNFVGKCRDDQLGQIFRHDMRSLGVAFDTPYGEDGPATARCLIAVTPDGERSMNTYIGACATLSPADIDLDSVRDSRYLFIEGYLWDPAEAIRAIQLAVHAARDAGVKIAFSLSDVFCVDRHRDEFRELIAEGLDILFANEREALALTQKATTEEALDALQGQCALVCVTLSEKGSVLLTPDKRISIPPQTVSKVVDATGAGDLYAAGVLYGLTQGWDLRECGELGSKCASQIIQQLGARSQTGLQAA